MCSSASRRCGRARGAGFQCEALDERASTHDARIAHGGTHRTFNVSQPGTLRRFEISKYSFGLSLKIGSLLLTRLRVERGAKAR